MRDSDSTFWKPITVIITKEGNHVLVSLKDQKRLMLLDTQYPKFLGRGRYSRSDRKNQKQSKDLDSGVDTEDECYNASSDNTPDDNSNIFGDDLPEDSVEVFEAYHEANQAFIEVRFPEGKNMTSLEVEEAKSIALLNIEQ